MTFAIKVLQHTEFLDLLETRIGYKPNFLAKPQVSLSVTATSGSIRGLISLILKDELLVSTVAGVGLHRGRTVPLCEGCSEIKRAQFDIRKIIASTSSVSENEIFTVNDSTSVHYFGFQDARQAGELLEMVEGLVTGKNFVVSPPVVQRLDRPGLQQVLADCHICLWPVDPEGILVTSWCKRHDSKDLEQWVRYRANLLTK